MAEPEEVIIDAARHATIFVSRLWQGAGSRDDTDDADVTLTAFRQRLELLLSAVFGYDIPVRVAQAPPPRSGLWRLFDHTPRHLVESRALPAFDSEQVFLPLRLISAGLPPFNGFRILALQQARRRDRRTGHPHPPMPAEAITRDLFLLSEAAAADHALALELPGLTQDLAALRGALRRERLRAAALNTLERTVEDLYCRLLDAPPAALPHPLILAHTPEDSQTWAEETARRISGASVLGTTRGYRGIAKDLWLGSAASTVSLSRRNLEEEAASIPSEAPSLPRTARLARAPAVREKKKDEDDLEPGMWMLQMDDPQQHVEDPAGMQRPTDRDDHADAGDLADSLAELPEARLVSSPQPVREILLGDDPPVRQRPPLPPVTREAGGIAYPEWDYRSASYRPEGAIIRPRTPLLGEPEWAESALARHALLLRQIRRRFEGLRPKRVRLNRQPEGDDIDIGAYVHARASQRAGLPLEDRLYHSVRPARRDIAIGLLIDISGSTDGWVSRDQRIIDVEKEALLLVYHALKVLGDPFCIHAFSGESQQNVSVWAIKDFEENDAGLVQRRIAALEPQHHTRAGAAIRHATALLAACPARYHLLLLLSDGKPNDVDHYEGRYGVEDMRQAVAEAILQSVQPFCITVDRQAPHYLARVFGPSHYTVLQHPERLPVVLVDMLRRLIKQ